MARARGRGEVQIGRLEELPWEDGSFDLITCLDVIEHTPDDRVTLGELRRVSRPGAYLLVTVPAYQGLWSMHDVANHHYRRYSRPRLRAAAVDAGWRVTRMTSFNGLLLAPAAAVRLAERRRLRELDGDYKPELTLGARMAQLAARAAAPARGALAVFRSHDARGAVAAGRVREPGRGRLTAGGV